ICDLTSENESVQNSLDFSESNDDSEEDIYYTKGVDNSEKDFEYEFHYVDEFRAEIHNNVITLTKNELIEACDYNVTFKGEKAAEAGTQLNTDSEIETDMLEDDCLETPKNKNQVPKVSNLTVEETQIAESVLKIRTANYCNIHNRACLNVDKSKEYYIEITFMMLSTWASEINKGLATPTEPPTHPLFAYNYLSKKRPSLQLSNSDRLLSQSSSSCLFPNSYIPTPFYNPLQMVPTFTSSYSDLEPTPYTTRLSIPTIGEFLKSIDENENTDDYYQSFLLKFEQQRISVRILSKLSNEEFEKCGVDTIGARQTL
ncbi:4800_t:CDS:2, partial [Dentiscutata erythropus]